MKKKILFGLLGLVVTMFTMTACSNDDDNNNGGVASGLKLTSVEWRDGEMSNYTYDEQGRIIKLSHSYSVSGQNEVVTFDYQNNTIKMTEYDNGVEGITAKYTIENGLITEGVETNDEGEVIGNMKYSYDKEGQLVSISKKYERYGYDDKNISINWKDGNIDSYTYNSNSGSSDSKPETYTCQYTSYSTAKGLVVNYFALDFGIPIYYDLMPDFVLFNLGYFGKQPKNLLSSVQYDDEIDSYTYTFAGKDGYVSSCTVTEKYDGKTYTHVQKYTWE